VKAEKSPRSSSYEVPVVNHPLSSALEGSVPVHRPPARLSGQAPALLSSADTESAKRKTLARRASGPCRGCRPPATPTRLRALVRSSLAPAVCRADWRPIDEIADLFDRKPRSRSSTPLRHQGQDAGEAS